MSSMVRCHICKEDAFVKTRLGATMLLDCGHVERIEGEKFDTKRVPIRGDYARLRKPPQKQKESEKRPVIHTAPPQEEPKTTWQPLPSTHNTSHNVAGTLKDLLRRKP